MKKKPVKKGTVKKSLGRYFGLAVIILGILLFLYPDLKTKYMDYQTAGLVSVFREKSVTENLERGKDNFSDIEQKAQENEELRDKILFYNETIFADGQTDFKDAWSVIQSPHIVDNPEDEMFGYIEIPAMELELPLYIGASEEHMAKGGAVLGETSIPVGGDNTNSVIAGHRGYRGAPYFRDIEKLSVGDAVYIINPWETLTYRVETIDIIDPDDSDAVKIQEGRDMVTLLTCHPYRSCGKYRYVVYCVRDESMKEGKRESGMTEEYFIAADGSKYVLSQRDIQIENLLRKCSAAVILFIVCLTFFIKKRRRDKCKK